MALSGLLLSFFNETDYLALYLGQLGVEDSSVVYSFSSSIKAGLQRTDGVVRCWRALKDRFG